MKSASVRYSFAVALAVQALLIQTLVGPLTGSDSYQVFLGVVAVSVIYGGTGSGLVTLSLTALAKLCLYDLPGTTPSQWHIVASRMVLFVVIGIVICSLGGQLSRSERILSAVLSAMSDAVITSDRKLRIRFMNDAARRLTGWTQEEAAGKRLPDVVRLAGGRLINREGKQVPVVSSSAPLHNESGFQGDLTVLRDQTEREQLIGELQAALAKVKLLSGLLPICSSCKKIRDNQGNWEDLEAYIRGHSEADFSHGICPECAGKLYPDIAQKVKSQG